MIIPVILSGGSGTRLWPLSRAMRPKQLLSMVSNHTMIQDTVTRLTGITDIADPIIVCNEEHRFTIAEQMREMSINPSAIILEPFGKNTAPAVAISALQSQKNENDPVLLVLPADHVIGNTVAFHSAVQAGYQAAMDNKLVTFGIIPDAPETGYGYIKSGSKSGDDQVFSVDKFVEKPDVVTAQSYLDEGSYYWNSGMFMFKASVYLRELEKHNNDMYNCSKQSLETAAMDMDFIRLDRDIFANCPSDSIDYAVMEKTSEAAVIPVDMQWNDIGSWSALWEVGDSDAKGNVTHGDVVLEDTNNTYVHADSRLVTTVGLNDLVVVETADAILVAHREKAQNVKEIVEQLKDANRDEAIIHHKAYRPWGAYECIDHDSRFQVKRITVNVGARLSLQLHHHRAEHWIIVQGTARVTCGDKVFLMSENESTYIPLGEKHRLENTGKIPLELIEVQTGSYLGEDDIVRFDDVYGREDKN
ncbi:MAG: mannose-1-phosphate guanylyltransferase/mannose-6-phosphate isomerase [endosymbiont of Galathealinum brachiosum]|uniref:mannose-1-phosphate guanylyltransferase n=1 Tax=endosymbiont of Galathealinum brachiosum TaxID=2200906 RepID=A0A370D9J3_9GAMM|nr:MAG: mannose-1-phosphate guanylyltransferase/mannose-6-phosphate isomerase [endosymbiont of Galathealinum brachiosum]